MLKIVENVEKFLKILKYRKYIIILEISKYRRRLKMLKNS